MRGKALKTKVFVDPQLAEVVFCLDSVGAVKQAPLTKSGLTAANQNRLPSAEGTLRLTHGAVAVVKAGLPDWCG